jgi:hypothetical protein
MKSPPDYSIKVLYGRDHGKANENNQRTVKIDYPEISMYD